MLILTLFLAAVVLREYLTSPRPAHIYLRNLNGGRLCPNRLRPPRSPLRWFTQSSVFGHSSEQLRSSTAGVCRTRPKFFHGAAPL